MDGDARGGAALSIRSVTGQPLKFVGVGEKSDALEPFHPDRVAQRILGMGDMLSLIEKVEESIDQKAGRGDAAQAHRGRFHAGRFPRPDEADPQAGAAGIAAGHDAADWAPLKDLKNVKVDENEITPHGGDHRFDDAQRARQSHDHQRRAPPAHRQGQRDLGAGSEQFAEAVRPDAQDDEELYGRRRVPGQTARAN